MAAVTEPAPSTLESLIPQSSPKSPGRRTPSGAGNTFLGSSRSSPGLCTPASLLPPGASAAFEDKYALGEQLGKGSTAEVWACFDRDTGQGFAAKAFRKARMGIMDRVALRNEVRILRRLRGDDPSAAAQQPLQQSKSLADLGTTSPGNNNVGAKRDGEGADAAAGGSLSAPPFHPGVVRLEEVLEGMEDIPPFDGHGRSSRGGTVFVVQELCGGGELLDLIVERGRLPEPAARLLFRQLASALEHCHAQGILHRDLKPDNILLDRPGGCLYEPGQAWSEGASPPVQAKLADFGVACMLPRPGDTVSGLAGSKYYTAPEMLQGKRYGFKADTWSLGVVLCAMLTAKLPFCGEHGEDMEGLREAIQQARVDFGLPCWEGVSGPARDLVAWMLQPEPERRPDAGEVLAHAWCSEEGHAAGVAEAVSAEAEARLCGSECVAATACGPVEAEEPQLEQQESHGHGNLSIGVQRDCTCCAADSLPTLPVCICQEVPLEHVDTAPAESSCQEVVFLEHVDTAPAEAARVVSCDDPACSCMGCTGIPLEAEGQELSTASCAGAMVAEAEAPMGPWEGEVQHLVVT